MKTHLILNESGTLETGTLFHVTVADESIPEKRWKATGGLGKEWEEGAYYQLARLSDSIHRCPRNADHWTDAVFRKPEVTAFAFHKLFEMLRGDDGLILVRQTLRDHLKALPLSGVELSPVIDYGDDQRKLGPLFAVQARKASFRLSEVHGHPNVCFKCGHGPIYCEFCGQMMAVCTKCNARAAVAPALDAESIKGKDQLYFEAGDPEKGLIVEGRLWDGQDLMQARSGWIMTKRFLNLFERAHFGLLHYRDARLCTDHMTPEQEKFRERALMAFN